MLKDQALNTQERVDDYQQNMWIFLVIEVLVFGLLFVIYGIYNGAYPDMFQQARRLLSINLGFISTLILILNSVVMAFFVNLIKNNSKKQAMYCLMGSLILLGFFLLIRYFEYSDQYYKGLLPGRHVADLGHSNTSLFFTLYFVMTGLHSLHVLMGMGFMFQFLKRILRNKVFVSQTPELLSYYSYFLNLIWIYYFPFFYSAGSL